MKVSVIGFGAVGSSVVALINNSFENGEINIIDPSPDIQGRFLDLSHAGALQNNRLILNSSKELKNANCVFYCAGIRNAKGASRATVVSQNKQLVDSIFKNIEFTNHPLIINLVNPVEAISFWIQEYTGSSCTVVSTGTGLDTFRLRFLLSDFYKEDLSTIRTYVMGEHGTEMVPVFSQTTIRKKYAEQILSSDEKINLKNALLNSAKSIRATEEATKFGVSQVAVRIFQEYFFDEQGLDLPMAIHSDLISDFMTFEKAIFFNVNTRIEKGKISYLPLEVSNQEITFLNNAKQSIEKTIYQ